jgi:hypothetical protein
MWDSGTLQVDVPAAALYDALPDLSDQPLRR